MKPKSLVLFLSSFQFQAGQDLVGVVVAAKATRYARPVLITWHETAHDPSQEIVLSRFHIVTIPARERSAEFTLKTNRNNFGSVKFMAALENGQAAEPQSLEVQPLLRIKETIPILISFIAINDGTDERLEMPNTPDTPFPIDMTVRLSVTEGIDASGGIAAHFFPKFLQPAPALPVSKVNMATGALALQGSGSVLLSIPAAGVDGSFIAGGDDSNAFRFRLNSNSLQAGVYKVDITVSLAAHDNANGKDFQDTKTHSLYFVKH